MNEGGAQGEEQPGSNFCIRDAEHQPPPPGTLALTPESRPGRAFCGPPGPSNSPRRTSWFPLSCQRSTASYSRFLLYPKVEASHSAHALRHSPQSREWLRSLGPRWPSGIAGENRTKWTPYTAQLGLQEGVYSLSHLGRRQLGAGHRLCPVEVGPGGPQDPLRVPAGREGEEEQGGARALLPESLPPVVGAPGPGEGGGTGAGGPRCEARAWLEGWRDTRLAPGGMRRTGRCIGGLASFRCTPG